MSFPTISYLDEQGTLSSNCDHVIADDLLLRGYRTMCLTRHIDDRMITLQRQGTISFALSAFGEEACSVASAAALSPEDWMYPQYRESGILFWRGFTVQKYIHHMFSNCEDPTLGRQMPNHFGCKELNVVTVSSPIATKIPHAAGCAYAMKLQKEKNVAISYFGDGATSEGDFHVGLNFAAVRRVPAIFFCRNNGYAISTACTRQFTSDGIAPKGIGYGIVTYRVDGNDFFAVHEIVTKARRQCIEGHGPVLIEAMTYRLGAHSTSDDPTLYRTEQEVQSWMKKCPILRLRLYLENRGLWDTQKEKALLEELAEEVSKAIEIAKGTAKPPLNSLVEDVYFEIPENLKKQLADLNGFHHNND